MKDTYFDRTLALPNAGSNNFTASWDINPSPGPGQTATFSNQWRLPRIFVNIPALATHTNASANITLRLQDSADGSNFADTAPIVEAVIPGIAVTGSAKQSPLFSFPPEGRRYFRFSQTADANAGGAGSNVLYELDL